MFGLLWLVPALPLAGFVFTLTYIFFFSWQGYYALLTLRRTAWGTR